MNRLLSKAPDFLLVNRVERQASLSESTPDLHRKMTVDRQHENVKCSAQQTLVLLERDMMNNVGLRVCLFVCMFVCFCFYLFFFSVNINRNDNKS